MIDKFIETKLSDIREIVEYHNNLFGTNPKIKSNSHLNMKENIFYLVSIFSSLDDNFEDDRLQLLLDDILNLVKYFDSLKYDETQKHTHDKKSIDEEYAKYQDGGGDLPLMDFKMEYFGAFKELRVKIVEIINTKLYYFDLMLWKKARASKMVLKFLRDVGANDSFSTKDFLHAKKNNFKPMVTLRFVVPNSINKPIYSTDDISFIKTLDRPDVNRDEFYEQTFDRLIGVKNKINIFKGMADGDIRMVVKDVNFTKFNPHEVIITEGEVSDEIYFILSGTCRVTANHKGVGAINEHQVFGEFSAITREQRIATVKTNSVVTALSFKLAMELFNDIPESFSVLYKNIIDELIIKINLANKKKF